MSGSAVLVSSILTFAALVALGSVLRALKVLKSEDSRALNAVIVYVGLPAFIFRAVHGAVLGDDLPMVIAVSWVTFAVCLAVAFLVERLLRLSRPRAGGFLIAASLGNTGYLGYPLVAAMLGGSALTAAVFSDVFGTVVLLVLVGMPLAARMGERPGGRFNPVKELLTFPAVIALFVGLALRPSAIPIPVSNGLDLLASMVAPLVMLSVGIALKPRSVAQGALALSVLAAIKLVVGPLVALGLGPAVVEGEALRVAVFQAGMPSMMLTFVVGERYGLDTDFIASAIFVTTVASAVTIPLVQSLAF